jgi:ribosome-associated protein
MTDEEDIHDEGPSKSELKRQSTELQALGEALIQLPAGELAELPLPENLRDAVELARRITAHGGLYRQKQYIGKLMRKIDAEPIRAALAGRKNRERVAALQFRRIELWRDRLLAEGSSAVEILKTDTGTEFDSAAVARLVDRAQAERTRDQPPHASRELFRVLREILGDQ